MGIRVGALAVFVVVLLVANVPAGSAGAGQASGMGGDETSTVTYSGTLNNTVQLVDSSGHVNEILTQDVTWRATWTGPTDMISDQSGETLPWTSVSLSGSDSIQYPDSNQGPGQTQNCADSLSAAGGQTFNAILPNGGDSITFALNTLSPHQSPTQGGGCTMPSRLACPPGSPANEQNGSYCSPDPAWKFKDGAQTFDISSNYGPTNVGGKVVTSDLSSTVSVSGAGCALSGSAAGAASVHAHAASPHLTVKAGPFTRQNVTASKYKFTAIVSCGTPNYHYVWKLDNKLRSKYLKVTPTARAHSTKEQSDQLPITIKCVLTGAAKKNSPESWHPCWSIVRFDVTVTDAQGRDGSSYGFFFWEGKCTSPSRKNVAKEKIEKLAEEIYRELPKNFAKHVTEHAVEIALEAEELGPYLAAHGLAELSTEILKQIHEADQAKEDLLLPNC